jgi:hypothetical protein
MSSELVIEGPDAQHRLFAACRLAKLLAYGIPNLDELSDIAQGRLHIEVVAAPGVNVAAYMRDSDIVAKLLGFRGKIIFEYGDPSLAEDPAPIVLFLLPKLCEGHEGFRRAARAESLMVGLSGDRLQAGLQGLFLQFSGFGVCVPIDCVLGDAVERSDHAANTMRFGWCMQQFFRSALNSEALINLEGHIDTIGLTGFDNLHALAGSVVRIGEQVLYVGHNGHSLSVTSQQLALCRPAGDRLYDVAVLPGSVSNQVFTAAGLLQSGAAVDHQIFSLMSSHYKGKPPDWKTATVVETAKPAVSLNHSWQSFRHPLAGVTD